MDILAKEFVTEKCVISGAKIEFYKYSLPIRCNFSRKSNLTEPFSLESVEENIEYFRRSDSLARARQTVRRVIWCNLTPHTKFLTLTVKENVTDVKEFRRMFTTFLQAMRRSGYDLKYLYVLERQKRGALHAHLVVFNDEKIPLKVLKKCWHYGRSEIKILNGLKYNSEEHIADVGVYVCKYITKESVNEFKGRTYNCSKGLKRPIELSLKSFGDFNYCLIEDSNDCNRNIVEQLLRQSNWNYFDTKIVHLDRSISSLTQVIDYFQGDLKGELNIEFK